MGQHQTAGGAKHVGEGLETAVGTGFEEEEGGEVALFTGQVLDQVEAETGVEAQGQQSGGDQVALGRRVRVRSAM